MAQALAKCLICDTTNPLEWKCLECDLAMCNSCKIVHERIPASREHKVVKVADFNASLLKKCTVPKPMKCTTHKQESTLYCLECHVPVCSDCIAETHKKHEFDKIKNVLEQKQPKINLILEEAENHKDLLGEDKDYIRTVKEDILRNVDEVKKAVKDRLNALKEELDKKANKCMLDVDKHAKESLKACDTRKDIMVSEILILDKQMSALQESLGNQDITRCETAYANLRKIVATKRQKSIIVSKLSFEFPAQTDCPFGEIATKNEERKFQTKPTKTANTCRICENVALDCLVLRTCKHCFCKKCITQHFRSVRNCPVCKTGYGIQTGFHRAGTVKVTDRRGYMLLIFEFSETFEKYLLRLPLTDIGHLASELLKIAFERHLLFINDEYTVKVSVQTLGSVLEQQTLIRSLKQYYMLERRHICSDNLLERVLDELATKGVTEVDLHL